MAEQRSALIVATSEYEDTRLAPLGSPGRDAESLKDALAAADIGGFDVQLAVNASHDDLRTRLESFFSDRARDDLLLVHFSCHGLKDDDGQLYLAAADTKIDRLMSTGVEAGWVNRLMTKCRSEKIALFLDCCFGGAFTAGLTRRAGVDTAGAKETFSGTGRFVITASDAMQYSFEGGSLVDDGSVQPSPFTSALVQGLTTGEADRNDDGFVSINELFDYLEDRVHQLSPAQTPTKSAFNQVGDWVIAQSVRAPTIRILPASVQAQLKSEDALDRFSALIDLRDLIQGSDPRVSEAALKALEKLTGDDSRRVAAAASRLFGEMPGGSAPPGVVTSTPLSQSSLPPQLKDALLSAGANSAVPPEVRAASPSPAAPASAAPSRTPAPSPPPTPAAPTPATTPPLSAAAPPAAQPTAQMRAAAPAAPWSPPGKVGATSSGPLWGAARSAPSGAAESPSKAKVPLAAAAPASRGREPGPWNPGRAFGRAAFGVAIGFGLGIFYEVSQDLSNAETDLQWSVLGGLAIIAAIFGGIVAAVEQFVPALQIPGGSAYAAVGHNRWIIAAALGVIPGLILVGLGGEWAFVVMTVIGLLASEALIGRPAPRPAG